MSPSTSVGRGVVRCGVAAVLFGASAPAASRIAGDMSPATLAGLLYLGAAVAVLPVISRHRSSWASIRRGSGRLAIAVVVGGAIGPVLLAAGLTRTSAASASLLLNLELVFTTMLAGLVFREHLGPRVVRGTLLVVVASVVLGWSGSGDVRWGAGLIAAACACWAVDNCVTANLDELAPSHITLVKGVVAGGANLAIGLLIADAPAGPAVVGALAIGVVGYGMSITLWVAGARDLGAARGQLVFATAPFVGVIVAWTLFSEPVTAREVSSIAIAAVGVGFVLRSSHTHEHHHGHVEHEHDHTHDDGHHNHNHSHGEPVVGAHSHRHGHQPITHVHPHVPDLHHRHGHAA